MANDDLLELDSVEILVIVDNELDPISPSPNPAVEQTGGMRTIGFNGPDVSKDTTRPGAFRELRMDHICCSAHGLSLMITGIKDGRKRTVLFDTGPEEHSWERNAKRLGADVGKIEVIQLSHWHRDHSGDVEGHFDYSSREGEGSGARACGSASGSADLSGHAAARGPVISLEADPSFAEIENAGAIVDKNDLPHTILDGMFQVSGEIPRVTPYEVGLRFGMRYEQGKGHWEQDEKMADERFLMCKLKDKGIVMFTGCSHAGVVNASRHALELSPASPLYAVMGGFHLADAEPPQIAETAGDLKELNVKVLLAGHCTGWRAKFEIQKTMQEGSLVPSFVGSKFVL